jgi:hypothetical protein
MEKLSSLLLTKLDGTTECDEFYIKAGLKGRSYHKEILKSARKPSKRGLKPWRGRGTFDKDQPMITCIYQRGNKMTNFGVPVHIHQILIMSVKMLNMVQPHLQMSIEHITNFRNMVSYTKV